MSEHPEEHEPESAGAEDTVADDEPLSAPQPPPDAPSAEAGPDDAPAPRRPSRIAAALAVFAFVLAIVALGGAGLNYWQARDEAQALERTNSEQRAVLEGVRDDTDTLGERVDALQQQIDTAGAQRSEGLAALQRSLDALSGQLAELGRRVDAETGRSFAARSSWLRAEAEYYLELANTELTLAGHWDNAKRALELADERLGALADPAVGPVRVLIAEELLALAGVKQPDIDGMAFKLAGLSARAEALPLRGAISANYENEPAAPEETPAGFGRLWQGLKNALSGIVRIERRDEPVEPVLTAEEGRLARRELILELELARAALVGRDQMAFDASLASASSLLAADFDGSDPSVAAVVAGIRDLSGTPLKIEPPDISRSLTTLRSLDGGGQ